MKNPIVSSKPFGRKTVGLGILALASVIVLAACFNSQAKSKINFSEKGKMAGKESIIGTYNGQELSEKDLPGELKKELAKVRRQEYEMLKSGLNQALAQKVFGELAKKANMSYEDYLEKKVYNNLKITDKDVKAFLKSRGLDDKQIAENPGYMEQAKPYAEAMKRQEILEERLAKETKSAKIEAFFAKPTVERITIDVGNSPMTSSKDAKVQIIEFSDFQCPYCSQAANTMTELKKKYGSKINIVFKHFPLTRIHPDAQPTSEMSMCVRELGGDKAFWKFHDIAFKNQRALDKDKLVSYAKEAGVKEADAKACFEAGKSKEAVATDMALAEKMQINATPTIFINGMENPAGLSPEAISEVIDDELGNK